MREERQGRLGDALVFAALAGVVSTFLHGYYCGRYNEVCQLPLLMHALDPGVLAKDFFVTNTFAHVGPRFFYIKALAFLCRFLSVTQLFVVLACLQNAMVALATYVVARDLFEQSDFAAAISTTLVMSVASVELGRAGYLFLPGAIPASLATGLALLALWQGVKCRPVFCVAFSLPAILIHPLVGLGAGGLGLAVSGISGLAGIGLPTRASRLKSVALTAGMFVVLAVVGGLFWSGSGAGRVLSSREYVALYGLFRTPHHVMPSFFPRREWIAMIFFLAAAVISWFWWYRQPGTDRVLAVRLAVVAGLLGLLWFGGWFFVEVLPSRFWAVLQPYRYVFVMKWLGLMLFGASVARLAAGAGPGQRIGAALLFLPAGFAQPHAVFLGHAAELLRGRLERAASRLQWFVPALAAAASAGIVAFSGWSSTEFLTLFVLALITVFWLELNGRWRRYLVSCAVAASSVALVVLHKYHPIRPLEGVLRGTQPTFSVTEVLDSHDVVAEFCRKYTPRDAVFLVPPHFERFRAAARRAVVVDFKCTLVTDTGLVAWRRRMADCYGEVMGRGFGACWEMSENYKWIRDEQVRALAGKYGASFAVLYQTTPTRLPVVFFESRFGLYKVVLILPEQDSSGAAGSQGAVLVGVEPVSVR